MTSRPIPGRWSRLASLADRYPAAVFVPLALAVSWGLWLPLLATRPSPTMLHVLPGGFGPTIAGLAVVRLRGEGVRAWLRERLDPRVGRRWYALAFGLPVLAGVAMGLIFVAATGSVATDRLARAVPAYLI